TGPKSCDAPKQSKLERIERPLPRPIAGASAKAGRPRTMESNHPRATEIDCRMLRLSASQRSFDRPGRGWQARQVDNSKICEDNKGAQQPRGREFESQNGF